MDKEVCELIWEEANKYLLSIPGISEELIFIHINHYKISKPLSLNNVYFQLLTSLTNRHAFGRWIGDVYNLKEYYFNYDSKKVVSFYQNWKEIFNAIKNSDFYPPTKMDISNSLNSWVKFCRGSLDGARFLSNFDNLKKFDEFVQSYIKENKHIELANTISNKIYGFGFSLSCDFLKELGYADFVKPDIHITDIFTNIRLCNSRKPEIIFTSLCDFARTLDITPYEADKMFWLIGSGYFHLTQGSPRFKVNKYDFCNIVN